MKNYIAATVKKILRLGYDAADTTTGRKRRAVERKSEDGILDPTKREKLVSETRDLRRNSADAAWAIRKHLDYVSTFAFQCRTGDDALDEQVESLFRWWTRAENCDVSGRHTFNDLIRLVEGLRTTDGDCFVMKLSNGQLQVIEGDRVRTPTDLGIYKGNLDATGFVHGVQLSKVGKALSYAISERTDANGFVLKSVIPAQYVYQHGFFDRVDQVRGVSPLAAALSTFFDLYEARKYALAKMKVAQIFALKLKRAEGTEAAEEGEGYTFDFGKGPQVIDLDAGDDADFLEAKTPSTEFQSFVDKAQAVGLKALDIPFSFYDEAYTNYSGARQAWLQYQQSAAGKQQAVQQLLRDVIAWRFGLFVADGELSLPDGWTIDDLMDRIEFVPAGIPWIDPLKEANAQAQLISQKLVSRQEISKARGRDWFEIVDQIAEEDAYIASKGLSSSAVDQTTTDQQTQDALDQAQQEEHIAEAVAEATGGK